MPKKLHEEIGNAFACQVKPKPRTDDSKVNERPEASTDDDKQDSYGRLQAHRVQRRSQGLVVSTEQRGKVTLFSGDIDESRRSKEGSCGRH